MDRGLWQESPAKCPASGIATITMAIFVHCHSNQSTGALYISHTSLELHLTEVSFALCSSNRAGAIDANVRCFFLSFVCGFGCAGPQYSFASLTSYRRDDFNTTVQMNYTSAYLGNGSCVVAMRIDERYPEDRRDKIFFRDVNSSGNYVSKGNEGVALGLETPESSGVMMKFLNFDSNYMACCVGIIWPLPPEYRRYDNTEIGPCNFYNNTERLAVIGMHVHYSSVIVTNSVFQQNEAPHIFSGAVHGSNQTKLAFVDCVFDRAFNATGDIIRLTLEGCSEKETATLDLEIISCYLSSRMFTKRDGCPYHGRYRILYIHAFSYALLR